MNQSLPNPPIVLTGSTAFLVDIAALKALCGRAADALEKSYQPMFSNQECHAHSKLITELRKAAE